MPYPLNNYTTQDTYTPSGEAIVSPPRHSLMMIVTGASVYFQLAAGSGQRHGAGETYGPETFVPPGRYTFDTTDSTALGGDGTLAGLQVRSAVAGTPAQVSIA